MIGSEYFPTGRRIQICFNPSTSLRRSLSEKLIRHVHSSSSNSSPSSVAALKSDTEDCEDMKASCVLPLAAAAASALSLPGSVTPGQSTLQVQGVGSKTSNRDGLQVSSDERSSLDDVVNAVGGMFYQAAGAVAWAGRRVMGHSTGAHDAETGLIAPIIQQTTNSDPASNQHDGHRSAADEEKNLLTIIKESSIQTEYFTTLLDSYDKVHDMLLSNGTQEQQQLTVFVPTDSAFQKLEGVLERSRAELLGEILEYHVLPGRYTAKDLRGLRTAETVLKVGDGRRRQQQRARIADGSSGFEVNFYARVLASESRESGSGVVHFVDEVLIPPPRWDVLVGSLAEETLGTFVKAMKRSGVGEELLRRQRGSGLAVFAPSNAAWAKLGEEVMDFLFSSPDGARFLEALMRYHFVAEVLYTDFFQDDTKEMEEEMKMDTDGGDELGEDADGAGQMRREVQTLLDGARVALSVETTVFRSANTSIRTGRTGGGGWPVEVKVSVNGAAVSARDVPVRDGVVHILDEVLLPPAPPPLLSSSSSEETVIERSSGEKISVEELKRRLVRFLEVGEEGGRSEEL
ncbi:Fasciclin domain-containing protein [Colletotrichum phormii]|uniref:Fasciclin domain-containing protein n=1 Tax=Colletotrichum phormii TaxID=359342 RepID=A0AAJ0A860_9PEZI|nr:Fasciclin domain-containing protein [Colletotrichum phormii]KAK1656305.1 Fasciclin domain-containing protein [Colletotrichum phormii]